MADVTGVNISENTWDNGLNQTKVIHIDTSLIDDSDAKTPVQVIATRMHPVLKKRGWQIKTNLLGQKSGRPYIQARLSRFAGEDEVSWNGGTRSGGGVVTGRKEQAHSVPYLTRISEKINQYVFGVEPTRDGIAVEVEQDITASGQSVNQFMAEGNNYLTAAGWYWIKVDAPMLEDEEISVQDKETRKIRPYWQNYSPLSVVDWMIDAQGNIQWVLTEEYDYIGVDPTKEATTEKFRRLWKPGEMTQFHFEKDDDGQFTGKIDEVETFDLSMSSEVSFILVGTISEKPHGFDTLESINRTIMDLESCNRQNFFNCVFPQRYFPSTMLDQIKNSARVDGEPSVTLNIGMDYPVFVDKDDIAPGVIMPDASSIKSMREELDALKFNMFEAVGLMLQQQSKQVASAEAKAWDFLDVKQVMKERSMIMEDAETKAVNLSKKWDESFEEWTPEYNKTFDVSNPEEDMKAIVLSQQMDITPTMERIRLRKTLDVFSRLGSGDISQDEAQEAISEIDVYQPKTFDLMPEPTSEDE